MNVDQIAAAIREHGEVRARIERPEVPELEDDNIDLGDGFHVQVRPGRRMLHAPRPVE
jgi:hypothetical protein